MTRISPAVLLTALLAVTPPAGLAQESGLSPFLHGLESELKQAVASALQTGQIDVAARLLFNGAQAGSPAAQVMLGFVQAEYGGKDSAALYWYRKAAAQRYPDAFAVIALMYMDGRGLPQDTRRANDWLLQAAILGNPAAQSTLAGDYAGNLAYGPAFFWGTRAADQGDEFGAKVVAQLRESAAATCNEVKRLGLTDLVAERCFTWIRDELASRAPAPDDCSTDSKFEAASGQRRDFTRNQFRLSRGLEAGVSECAFGLGMGEYVMGRRDDAHRLLMRAALGGHADAQAMLAGLYADQKWSAKDPARSVFWLGTAAQNGSQSALKGLKETGLAYGSAEYGITPANLARLGYTAEGLDEPPSPPSRSGN